MSVISQASSGGNKNNGNLVVGVKGSAEAIKALSKPETSNSISYIIYRIFIFKFISFFLFIYLSSILLSKIVPADLEETLQEYGQRGFYVLGLGYRVIPEASIDKSLFSIKR